MNTELEPCPPTKNYCSLARSERRKDFVVIDDDLSFCLSMVYAARRKGYTVDYYTSLLDMGSIGQFERYHVAIVDYNLEQMSGLEVAEYFPVFFNEMPVLLISSSDQATINATNTWPKAIKRFVNKGDGADGIISAAASLRAASGPVPEKATPARPIVDSPPMIRALAEAFLHTSSQAISDLNASIAGFDFSEIGFVAKKLNASARSIGASKLSELAARLEVHARHKNIAVVYTLAKEIELCWSNVVKKLRQNRELVTA